MPLREYRRKRDFRKTPEPKPGRGGGERARSFVVHEHRSARLHYDLRLEAGGVLKSWAVPKGIPLDPAVKRLAIAVEDHPLEYLKFRGRIPKGSYGAGLVVIWDKGTYSCPAGPGSTDRGVRDGIKKGHLDFELRGKKLRGGFALVRLRGRDKEWLLMKKRDGAGRTAPGEKKAAGRLAGIKFKGAVRSAMPSGARPMLATLVDKPFDRPGWIFEVKWDGYRALAEVRQGRARLVSRNGRGLNERFPAIAESLRTLPFDALLDGEIVAVDRKGRPRFQLLQNYSRDGRGELIYYLFDLLYLAGYDFRPLPLKTRRGLLAKIIPPRRNVRLSEPVARDGVAFYRAAEENELEGIMAKDDASPYRSGVRSRDWLKIKTEQRQEVIVCGYTRPRRGRRYFGALIAGVYEGDGLRYAGRVGAGFDEAGLRSVWQKLQPLAAERPPLAATPKPEPGVSWVKPVLVAEVKFKEWTDEGIMRMPVFLGLRDDKAAKETVRETPGAPSGPALTNLDKVFWPKQGWTKKDVIEYYERIAEWILPHLRDRPQALNRHPDGIGGESFFQKDIRDPVPGFVKTVKIASGSGKKEINYLVCQNRDTLRYLANLGCIEINTFNSAIGHLEKPDYLILDFDPVEVPFSAVVKVVLAAKEVLDGLRLPGFCKTSGGRGMHVYVPLEPGFGYEPARNFVRVMSEAVRDRNPELASLERSPRRRRGRVYLDYLQNRPGATMAAPYSLRPRDGAPVSAPLEWSEVKENLDPLEFNIRTVPERLARKGDPWKDMFDHRVDLAQALKELERKR